MLLSNGRETSDKHRQHPFTFEHAFYAAMGGFASFLHVQRRRHQSDTR